MTSRSISAQALPSTTMTRSTPLMTGTAVPPPAQPLPPTAVAVTTLTPLLANTEAPASLQLLLAQYPVRSPRDGGQIVRGVPRLQNSSLVHQHEHEQQVQDLTAARESQDRQTGLLQRRCQALEVKFRGIRKNSKSNKAIQTDKPQPNTSVFNHKSTRSHNNKQWRGNVR